MKGLPVNMLWAFIFGLSACKAERLGVRVPPSGADALTVEDLQRDSFALGGPESLQRGPGSPGAVTSAAWMQERLAQMDTVPGYGREWASPLGDGRALVCGQRDGEQTDAIVVLAEDRGQGAAGGAVPMAVVIGLAKTWAGTQRPGHTLVFCSAPSPGGLQAYLDRPVAPLDHTAMLFTIGPFGEGALRLSRVPNAGGPPRVQVSTARPPADPATDLAEHLDYRQVLDRVRELRAFVDQPPDLADIPTAP